MVHEKYIRKNGKLFGPYLYETKRVNGKIITTYVGKGKAKKPKNKRRITAIGIHIAIFLALIGLFAAFSLYIEPQEKEADTISLSPTVTNSLEKIKTHQEAYASEERTFLETAQQTITIKHTTQGSVVGTPQHNKIILSLDPDQQEQETITLSLPKKAIILTQNQVAHPEKTIEEPTEETLQEEQSEMPESEEQTQLEESDTEKETSPIQRERISLSPASNHIDFSNGLAQQEITLDLTGEITIEYEIPAQSEILSDTATSSGRRLVISGDASTQNALLIYELPQILQTKNIRIYDVDNEKTIKAEYEDTNNDGNPDTVSWVIDHFSERTFDIILVTNAAHLDEKRTFINDISKEVFSLDNLWTETIPSDHYVRVIFERTVTSKNDITIYPRILTGNPRIEVYEENQDQLIAVFDSINNEAYNKITLEQLQGEQDTFDLRIQGGEISFDHIIDPTTFISTCQFLSLEHETYVLTDNILDSGTCFSIGENNITIDGQGLFSITGSDSGFGIDNTADRYNLTVQNVEITQFATEIAGFHDGGCRGANIVIRNASVGAVDVHGPLTTQICSDIFGPEIGRSNDVRIFDANVTSIDTHVTQDLGIFSAGNITIDSKDVFLDGVTIDASCTDGCALSAGTLSINYSNIFTDAGASYGPEIKLRITNESSGSIDWGDQEFTNLIDLSASISISHNHASFDSQLNTAANITLYNSPGSGQQLLILKNSIDCGIECVNHTPLDAESVLFSVAGPGTYSIGAIDLETPLVTIASPTNGTTYTLDQLPLTYAVTLNEQGAVNFTFDNGVTNTTMSTTDNLAFTFVDSTLTPGDYTFQVYATDQAGNQNNTEQVSFTVQADPTQVTDCGELNLAHTTYFLQNNIITTGTCFTVTAENITLDGQGFAITGDNGQGFFGINAEGINTLNIEDTTIQNFDTSIAAAGVIPQIFPGTKNAGSTSKDGGTITLSNTIVETVQSNGVSTLTSLQGSAGNGGTIIATSSTFEELSAQGGNAPDSSNVSTGGSITIQATNLNIAGKIIEVAGGSVSQGSDVLKPPQQIGPSGTILINYSEQFNDNNANYGKNVFITITNTSANGASVAFSEVRSSTPLTNLSQAVELSFNQVVVDTTTNPALDVPATLTLSGSPGVPFVNPTILSDGIPCGVACANATSLTAPHVEFTVPGFSTYSIGEELTTIDITVSDALSNGVQWNITDASVVDAPAQNNSNSSQLTEYFVTVTTSGVLADIYIRADADLISDEGAILAIANETFSIAVEDPSVPEDVKIPLTFSFADNQIADNIPSGTTVHLKFFLTVPQGQPAGSYANAIEFIAMEDGILPP